MSFVFNPVTPTVKSKSLTVAERKPHFPEVSVITLNEIKANADSKRPTKSLELSPKAIAALDLSGEKTTFGVFRAFVDEEKTDERIFLFSTEGEKSFEFVNKKTEKTIKVKAAALRLTTGKAQAADIYDTLSEYHTGAANGERHFKLVQQFQDKYWLLEEYVPTTETPTAENTDNVTEENVDSPGETADVTFS
jgi:hypothetical protein